MFSSSARSVRPRTGDDPVLVEPGDRAQEPWWIGPGHELIELCDRFRSALERRHDRIDETGLEEARCGECVQRVLPQLIEQESAVEIGEPHLVPRFEDAR